MLHYICGYGLQNPGKRIHVDFAGPFMGKMFFIVVDAYSKSPGSLFLQREICTRLDLLQPTCSEHVLQRQTNQKKNRDQHVYAKT